MSLSDILRKGILAAGLVGVMLVTQGGCVTTKGGRGEYETLAGLILTGTGIQRNDPAVAAVGQGLIRYGAAQAGSNEVNVNVNIENESEADFIKKIGDILGGTTNSSERKVIYHLDNEQKIVDDNFKNSTVIPAGEFYIFAANYWRDFNEDGASSPNEYVGIKDKFREDERLTLVMYDSRYGLKDREIVSEIYSPSGNLIDTDKNTYGLDTGEVIYHRKLLGIGKGGASLTNFLVEKGGFGNYKVIWKLDGEYNGSAEFEIVPSLQNNN